MAQKNRSSKAIGIIIGGTNISIGLVASTGEIIVQTHLETRPRDGFSVAMNRIFNDILGLCDQAEVSPRELRGVGVGCTGPVDPRTGTVLTDFTLPTWKGFSISSQLQDMLNIPVVVENNVDAAVVGEAFLRSDNNFRNVVLITFGTGVGGAVLLNGEIYRGTQGEHPELGHILVRDSGPNCYCGHVGCLEMVASGTAIGLVGKQVGIGAAPEVFARAKKGDQKAKDIIELAVECTARGIWIILHTFLPEMIVLGGGVMEAHYEIFEPAIRRTVSEATMVPADGVVLNKAMPSNINGIVGAGVLALKHS